MDETSEGVGIKHLGTINQTKGGGKIAIDSASKSNTFKRYGTISADQKGKPIDFHSSGKPPKEETECWLLFLALVNLSL